MYGAGKITKYLIKNLGIYFKGGGVMRRLYLFGIAVIVSLICVHTAKGLDLKTLQEELRRKGSSWIAGSTSVSHLSWEEKQNLCGLPMFKGYKTEEEASKLPKHTPPSTDNGGKKWRMLGYTPPSTWDWRNRNGKNWMSTVKAQGSCGSCWAFAWVSAQEARMNIFADSADWNPDLSEQFVVSCNPYGYGCNGGWTDLGNWVRNDGICEESCFSYTANERSCSQRCSDWRESVERIHGRITDWGSVSESRLKDHIMDGPVDIGVRWSKGIREDFFYYKGGVYEPVMGKWIKGGHAICACGWNSSGKILIKNSWGTGWGSGGYGYIDKEYWSGSWMNPDVKSDTGTPIIWATDSLDFVFGLKGKSSPTSSLGSNKTTNLMEFTLLDGEHILEPLPISESHKGEDTLQYDNNIGGNPRWYLCGWNYWGVRFTPPRPCKVIGGLVGRYTSVAENDKLILRDDEDGRKPGTIIEEVPYTTQAVDAFRWYRQDLSTPYSDGDDFWLTYYAVTEEYVSGIGGDDAGGARSYCSNDANTWNNFGQEDNSDLLIRAIVNYGGYAGSGIICVKNVGAGKLMVSAVHTAQSSSWIMATTPKSFTLYHDDSTCIEVSIDTSGLQLDTLYKDEIVITSNSNKVTTETRVPVTLLIKSGSVDEEPASMLSMFKLSPNPFRGKIGISYFVQEKTHVKLTLYDITGREVAKIVDKPENPGIKKIEWNTKNISSGIYFCRFTTANFEDTRKVLLIR